MSAALENVAAAGWQAELRLRFGNGVSPHLLAKGASPSDTRTRLVHRSHRGPLVIQRPFYPEGDPCHVYVVHPPGGVVGGDQLRVDVEVEAGAHALITTPAATKFYRAAQRASSQLQEARVAGATLEWLPQENIFFPGAETHTATRVHLDAESKFIGWEIACLGLPARGEPFDTGHLRLDLELWRRRSAAAAVDLGSEPIFIDRLRLAGDSQARSAAWGLAGFEAVGTLLATPASSMEVDAIRVLLADRADAAVTLVDGVLVLRALERQGEMLRKLFINAWRLLRPRLLGRDAVPPRIWAT
jgi:urease accessory protein